MTDSSATSRSTAAFAAPNALHWGALARAAVVALAVGAAVVVVCVTTGLTGHAMAGAATRPDLPTVYAATGYHGAQRVPVASREPIEKADTEVWAADESARGTRPDASH